MSSRPQLRVRPAYEPLRHLRSLYVGIEGARGTAKTTNILAELVVRSVEFPGCRIVLAREDRIDLSETVLKTFEEDVLPMFGMKTPGGQARAGRTVYDMPNGSQFIPIGIKNMGKSLSFEATFAYVNEATECTKKKITDLSASLRYLKTARRPTLPEWNQLIFDVNPINPNHWTNEWMEPVDDSLRDVKSAADYMRLCDFNWRKAPNSKSKFIKRIITKHQDNPGYWEWDKWEWTPLGRKYVEETLESQTGFQRERWLYGRWVAAEGGVYANSFGVKNIIRPFRVPHDWPVDVVMDFGRDHPTAVLWITISNSGKRIVFDEIHASGLDGVREVAAMIKQKNYELSVRPRGYYGDPRHGWASTFQSPITIAGQFDEQGIAVAKYPQIEGAGMDGAVDRVASGFRKGDYLFTENCVGCIADHRTWQYKRNPDGTAKAGDDQYEDKNNDACDCFMGYVGLGLQRDEEVVVDLVGEAFLRQLAEADGVNPEASHTRE